MSKNDNEDNMSTDSMDNTEQVFELTEENLAPLIDKLLSRRKNELERHELKTNPKKVAEVYLDVGDSGMRFSVKDEGFGPTIEISSGAFGNCVSTQKIHTDVKSLLALSEMFDFAAKEKYSEEYVNKGRVRAKQAKK